MYAIMNKKVLTQNGVQSNRAQYHTGIVDQDIPETMDISTAVKF